MSFLSIAFLAALPLAAAPILLHLFDRRRNAVIEWGAMQFLLEAATRRTSARRLRQWLLLLLRVMAIAALVLALARPMLPGNWFGLAERAETVIVIDNSMSMLRTADGQSLLEQAAARASEIIDEMPAGDSVRVLLSSPYPVWARGGSLRVDSASRAMLTDELRQLRPTQAPSDLLASLFTAAQAEIEPPHERRRIVLLTDGQYSDWKLEDEAGWQRFREVLQSVPVPTELDIIELEGFAETAVNLAVDRVHANRTVVGVNQPFTLTAQILNHGSDASSACSVRWSIAEEEATSGLVPGLEGGQSHDVVWKHSLAKPGVYKVTCQIDADDALSPDNQATRVVEVVESVPVVVLEGAGDHAELQQDAFFLQAALGFMHGEPLGAYSVHVPLVVDNDQLARLDLSDYRAVVVPNLTLLDDELIERLRAFVSAGGGLWLALGARTDVEAFNRAIYADGNGLAPLAVDRIEGDDSPVEATDRSGQTRIDLFANEHPATAELADNQRLDTGDITVFRRFRFVAPPPGRAVSVLLSLTDGQPLAVEKLVGRGRVIVQAIPLRLDWSELARSQAFVVMAHDWLSWLSEPLATQHNLAPGNPISFRLADAEPRYAMLRTPRGDEIELAADATSDGVVFRSSRTSLPGDYTLELGSTGRAIPFHVSRDPEESGLKSLSSDQRVRLAEIAGLSRDSSDKRFTGNVQRDPLWPTLLVILIGLISGELMLSGAIARERFGVDTASDATATWLSRPTSTGPDVVDDSQAPHSVSTAGRSMESEPVKA